MLRFAVYDDGRPATSFPLAHAHLVGPDDVPTPAAIAFKDGVIECEKRAGDNAGISLVVDVGQCGRLLLRTCLLPEREAPYSLFTELARHRLMLFLNKLEEWFQCDLPAADPAMQQFEEARAAFTDALCAPPGEEGAAAADAAARKALCLAVQASEKLAQRAAEILLAHRLRAAKGAAGPTGGPNLTIGCSVRRDQSSPGLKSVVRDHFDFMCSPMRWRALEPDEGEYSFTKTDKWIEWAVREARMPVTAGPIIDFRPGRAPEWLSLWENDFDTLREVVFQHVKKVVQRYHKGVSRWTVCSGLHLNATFDLTLDQIMELTRICVMVVRKSLPNTKIQIEVDQPFGEWYATHPASIPPLLYAELATQQGLSVDAIALRVQMGSPEPGHATRDLMQLSAMLDAYSVYEKPIVVTGLGAPSAPPSPPTSGEEPGSLDPGWWRAPWSPEAQADWLANALVVALAKPYVVSVSWHDLYDAADQSGEMPFGGLIDSAGQPKPALRRLLALRKAMVDASPSVRLPLARAASPTEA